MSLSAAELQKRHGLEGAPDPFPTLGNGPAPSAAPVASTKKAEAAPANVDTSSEDAFPSLGAPTTAATTITKPAISMWSSKPSTVKTTSSKLKPSTAAGGLGRTGTPTAGSHPFNDTFSLNTSDIETGKVMIDLLKKVQEQTGAVVESSTQMRTGLKTFYIKAADQKRLVYARRMIERGLSKTVTVQVEVPVTTLGTIIGPKGATLKGITDSTNCKIDIPRRDTLPQYDANQGGEDDGSDGEDDEPQVAISITGPSVACNDAKAKILSLISHKTFQSSASIKTIPSSYYPFISGPKGVKARQLEEEVGEGQVKVHIPPPAVWKALEKQSAGEEEEGVQTKDRDLAIKVRGEKEKVKAVVAEINRRFEELNDNLRELKISIPKRQHRFLVGPSADEILSDTDCIVELPPVDDASDQCVIRGPQPSLIKALTLVMDKANAISVETVDVVALHRPNTSDPLAHAQKVIRYLQRSGKLRSIAEGRDGVKVFPPFPSVIAASGAVSIEIVGENKAEVAKAKEEVGTAVKSILPAGIAVVEIEPIVHSLLIGKKGSKIAQFETTHNVTTVFPPAADESSEVLLFYTAPLDTLPSEKKARDSKLKEILSAATTAINDLAKGAADIKTETLDVEKKWHRHIIGTGGTILNALIGEDGLVNVKVGAQNNKAGSKAPATTEEDVVVIRGPSTEVDRVVAQIKQIVEDAKNDDIVNGYTVEFNVDKKHVPHLVGSAGAAINRLRETLGVKVNFDDDEKKAGKKVVATCKIVGRKEAVEEAKKRLDAQIEKLEDETTEVVTIKRAIQPALIGAGGKYAIRLEEKYGVKLSFPRDNKDKDASAPAQKPDEVTIRGGKKGVAAAKAELLEAAAFETETRQTLTFTVPTKSVSQIVGKGGATINGIKDETGVQIDIDKTPGEGGQTSITVRGDKKGITAAKAAVLGLAESIGEEVTDSLTVEPKYHRSLIGQGGQKLRDLITAAGGPSEGYKQAGIVTFPKQGDDTVDQVRLRGESKVVKAIKAELEKQVKVLRETIVKGVVVPASQHAGKIGRGGSALQDLQRKTGAAIHFPGSRQYASVGDIENAAEVENAEKSDIVKVIGTKEACDKAIESLQTNTERPPRTDSRQNGNRNNDDVTSSHPIPKKYYYALADQQNLIRQIRNAGGFLSVPQPAPARVATRRPEANGSGNGVAKSARIDLDGQEEEGSGVVEGEWELRENYVDGDEETLDWVVRAKEQAELEKASKVLEAALDRAKSATHVGVWTGLPRSAFPRIIGSKGATISRLRVETGADIQVGKDDDLITITGDESSVLQAKDAISQIVSQPSRGGGGRY